MLRTLGHCILLVILVLISCVGLLYGRNLKLEKQPNDNSINLGGPDQLSVATELTKSVSLEKFRKISRNAKSFHDLYRIFLKDKKVSDQAIDKMLTTRSFRGLFPKHTREYEDYDEWAGDDFDFDDDIRNVADEALLHYLEVKDHPLGSCNDPTPEVRHVPPEGNRLYFPEYTILHVCRNVSGCCWNPAQECAEKEIEIVPKSFIVTELQHTDRGASVSVPEANKVEIKFFVNVTRCGCKELAPLPECDKKCPFPFIKEQSGPECICDCKHDHLKCLEIKYGIEPIDDEEFQCIKDEKCMKPLCDSGEFDMRKNKGYCPGTYNAKMRIHTRDKRDVLSGVEQKHPILSRRNIDGHKNR